MRLIDADALPFEPYGEDVISWYATGWNDAINVINRAPTVDAEPVRCGKWIVKSEFHGCTDDDGWWTEWTAQCSECGMTVYLDGWLCEYDGVEKALEEFNYCPKCGAKMKAENDYDD